MKVSEIYYNFFKKMGYKEIFGVPGSYIMPLWQEFDKEIKIILARHENGAVFMGDGWARNNHLPGVVLTTIGPGLTNAITGIACAYQDSIPLIVISGYVPTNMNNKGAFQNSSVDDRGFMPNQLLSKITKATYLPQTADEAIKDLSEAYKTAISGRKGPVHISLPFDIQTKESNLDVSINIEKDVSLFDWKPKFIELINNAKRPIFYCGNGCFLSNATELMNKISEKNNIPIISSIKGASACSISNNLYWGITGNVLKKRLYKQLKKYNADLVISLGSSLSFNSFNNYDEIFKDVDLIRIDIDKNQFNNYKKAKLNINMDVSEFLKEILNINISKKNFRLNFKIDEEIPNEKDNIFSQISDYMYRTSSENTLFIPDAGNHWLDILYWCYPKQRLGLFTNAGLASMGHAIGASIGFKISNPDKEIICITGDGSFMMSGMEISEAIRQNLNMTFIVVNNSSLGRARVYQEMTDKKIISTKFNDIDIMRIGNSLGAISRKVETVEQFKKVFQELKGIYGVKLIEVLVEKNDCPKFLRR